MIPAYGIDTEFSEINLHEGVSTTIDQTYISQTFDNSRADVKWDRFKYMDPEQLDESNMDNNRKPATPQCAENHNQH